MSKYYLVDVYNEDDVMEFDNPHSVAISCLGRRTDKITIWKDFDMIPRPYPADVSLLEKYISSYEKSFLEKELFEI